MKNVYLLTASILALTFAVAASAAEKGLEGIPAGELSGITVSGCEAKPIKYSVNCRSGGKCTISVTPLSYTCKGVKK